MYTYKFFWDGEKKIQNAWGTWEFPECSTIYYIWFLNNYLYMVVKRNDQVCLERIRFDEDVYTSARQYTAYIDRFVRNDKLVMEYHSETDTTRITLPFRGYSVPLVITSSATIPAFRAGIVTTDTVDNETVFSIDFTTDTYSISESGPITWIEVEGDVRDYAITVGIPYTFYYEFSRQYLRKPSSKGGERPILEGRVQLRYMSLEYHDTPYFQFNTTVTGRDTVTATYNGDTIGSDNNIVGQVSFGTGVQRIPLMGSAGDVKLTITNDGPFGNSFGSAEWQAIWTPRSQRIN